MGWVKYLKVENACLGILEKMLHWDPICASFVHMLEDLS
jgi:hypothetical protein